MNFNNLHMTVGVYNQVSKSILDNYVRKDELGEMAYEHDVPIGTDDSYVRKWGEWIPAGTDIINSNANNPSDSPCIIRCDFPALFNHTFEKGDIITISSITHQETNTEKIVCAQVSIKIGDTDFEQIAQINPTAIETTVEFQQFQFTILDSASIKFEITSADGIVSSKTIDICVK